MINVRDDGDVSYVLHIVNDRLVHVANVTNAFNWHERDSQSRQAGLRLQDSGYCRVA
jgi:hypothetical protein